MRYAIIVGLPAGLEAVSVTSTRDTYHPFAPFVPPLLDVVTGGAWVPPPPLFPTSWSVIECATSRFPAWSVAKKSTVWDPSPEIPTGEEYKAHAAPSVRVWMPARPEPESVALSVTVTDERYHVPDPDVPLRAAVVAGEFTSILNDEECVASWLPATSVA